jgi:hypothetical protein
MDGSSRRYDFRLTGLVAVAAGGLLEAARPCATSLVPTHGVLTVRHLCCCCAAAVLLLHPAGTVTGLAHPPGREAGGMAVPGAAVVAHHRRHHHAATGALLAACLPACLLACLPACLLVCLLACRKVDRQLPHGFVSSSWEAVCSCVEQVLEWDRCGCKQMGFMSLTVLRCARRCAGATMSMGLHQTLTGHTTPTHVQRQPQHLTQPHRRPTAQQQTHQQQQRQQQARRACQWQRSSLR